MREGVLASMNGRNVLGLIRACMDFVLKQERVLTSQLSFFLCNPGLAELC